MSVTVDERVVEMKFDNEAFEKNVSSSIDSLEKLKESLKFDTTTKSIDDIQKSINRLNFDKINKAADTISKRFSAVGIIIDQTLRRITDKGLNTFSSILGQVMSGGQRRAQNMASAEFTLKGFLKDDADGKKLEQIMDSVKASVDGTAYSMDAAAKVAAQLIPTGIEGGEQLLGVLKGIAGTAAMTGSSFEDIGHIFTTVSARGKLMGEQIQQFSYRGLNATEVLAQQLGKSGAEITKMISKGQIDFMTFATAMENAFGAHAYKANETYAGSLANLNSALSRIGQPIQAARMNAMKGVFNGLRLIVNDINKALQPLIKNIESGIKVAGLFAEVTLANPLFKEAVTTTVTALANILADIALIFVHIGKGIASAFPPNALQMILNFANHLKNVSQYLQINTETGEKIQRVSRGIFKIIGSIVRILWSLLKALKPVFAIAGRLLGLGLDLLALLGDLLAGIADFTDETQILSKALNGIISVLSPIANFLITTIAVAFYTVGKAIKGVVDSVGQYVGKMRIMGEEINSIFKNSDNFGEGLFKSISYLLAKISDAFSSSPIVSGISNFFANMFGNIATFFSDGINLGKKFIDFLFSGKGIILGFAIALGVLTKQIWGVTGSIKGLIKDARMLVRHIDATFVTNNMLKVATSVTLIAASLGFLALATKNVSTAKLFAIATALAGLTAAVFLISKIQQVAKAKKANPLQTIATIAGIALIIVAVAKLASTLDTIKNFDQTFEKLKMVSAVIMAISAISLLLSMAKSSNYALAANMIGLTGSMYMICLSLNELGKFDPNRLKTSSMVLLVVMGIVAAISIFMSRLAFAGTAVIRPLIVMTLSMLMITKTAETFAKMLEKIDYDKLQSGLEKLKGYEDTLWALSALLVGIGIAAHGILPLIVSIGRTILAVAAAMFVLSIATAIMSLSFRIDPKSTSAAIAAITAMSTIMMIVAGLFTTPYVKSLPTNSKNIEASVKALGSIIKTIGLVTGLLTAEVAILSISGVKWEDMIAPVVSIMAIMGFLALNLSQLRDLKIHDNTVAMFKTINSIILAMSITFGVMSAFSAIGGQNGVLVVGSMMALMLVTLRRVLETVSDLDSIKINKNMTSMFKMISEVIISVMAVLTILSLASSQIGGINNVLASAASIALVILPIIEIVKNVSELDGLTINKNTLRIFKMIAVVIVSLSTVMAIMSLIGNPGSLIASGLAMAGMIAVFIPIIRNIQELADLTINKNTIKTIAFLGGVFAAVGAVMAVMSAVGNLGSLIASGLAMAGIIAVFIPIIRNIQELADLTINKNTIKTIAYLGGIFTAIGAVIAVMSAVGNPGSLISSGLAMAGIIAVFIPIIRNIQELADLTINQNTIKTISTLGRVFAGIGAVIGVMSLIGNPGSLIASGLAMAGIIAVFIPIIRNIQELKNLSINENTIKTISMLGKVFAGIGVVVGLMSLIGNPGSLIASGLAMAGIIAVFIPIIRNIQALKNLTINKNTINTIIVLGSVFSALGVVVGVISAIGKGIGNIIASAIALSGVIVVFSLVAKRIAVLSGVNIKPSAYITIGILGAAITAMAIPMAIMSAIGKDAINILASSAAIIMAMGVMAAVTQKLASIQNTGLNAGVIVTILMLSSAIGQITGALEKLQNADPLSLVSAAGSLSLVLVALSGSVAILSKFTTNIAAAIASAISVSVMMLAIIPLLNSLSQIKDMDIAGMQAAVNGLIGLLATLGIMLSVLSLIGSTGIGLVALVVAAAGISAIALSLAVLANSITGLVNSLSGLMNSLAPLNEFIGIANQLPNAVSNFTVGVQALSNATSTYFQNVINDFNTFNTNISNELDALNTTMYSKMQLLGQYASQGYKDGMSDKAIATVGAKKMVLNAFTAVVDAQQSHSPSELFKLLGLFAGAGYGEGIEGSENGILGNVATLIGGVINNTGDYSVDFEALGSVLGDALGRGFVGSASAAIDGFLANAGKWYVDTFEGGGGYVESDSVTNARAKYNEKQEKEKDTKRTETINAKKAARNAYNQQIGLTDEKIAEMSAKDAVAYMNGLKKAEEKEMKARGLDGSNSNDIIQNTFDKVREQLDDYKNKLGLGNDETAKFGDTIDKVVDGLGGGAAGAGGGGGGLHGAMKQAADDAMMMIDSYDDLNKSLKDTIDNQMDIFTAFEKKTELTGAQVLENMRSQIEGVTEWSENLNKLAFRGMNKALLQELSKLGPQGYEKVNAFVQMTDEQLAEANDLYAQRLALPDAAATYITDSFAQAGMWTGEGYLTGLDPYVAQSQQKGLDIAAAVKNGIESGLDINSPSKETEKEGFYTGEGLARGLILSIPRVQRAARLMCSSVLKSIKTMLSGTSLNSDGASVFGSFSKGISKSVPGMSKVVNMFCIKLIHSLKTGLPDQTFYDSGYNIFNQMNIGMDASFAILSTALTSKIEEIQTTFETDMKKVGEFAAEGLSAGIKSKINEIAKSTMEACKASIQIARETLDENSPSGVFLGIGKFITVGLANGITSGMIESNSAIEKVASNTIGKFHNAISKIRDSVNMDDDELVIRPVMDTSNIESGLTRISTMFDSKTYSLDASIERIKQTGNAYSRANKNAQNSEPTQTVNNYTTFNQTNTSPKALTNAEIYRQTNNLISRMRR